MKTILILINIASAVTFYRYLLCINLSIKKPVPFGTGFYQEYTVKSEISSDYHC